MSVKAASEMGGVKIKQKEMEEAEKEALHHSVQKSEVGTEDKGEILDTGKEPSVGGSVKGTDREEGPASILAPAS